MGGTHQKTISWKSGCFRYQEVINRFTKIPETSYVAFFVFNKTSLAILSRWWFQIFSFFTPGEMIQFDEHIFEMVWFNHQLEITGKKCFLPLGWGPLNHQPHMYTLYHVGILLGPISPFKGVLLGYQTFVPQNFRSQVGWPHLLRTVGQKTDQVGIAFGFEEGCDRKYPAMEKKHVFSCFFLWLVFILQVMFLRILIIW